MYVCIVQVNTALSVVVSSSVQTPLHKAVSGVLALVSSFIVTAFYVQYVLMQLYSAATTTCKT